MNLSKAVYVFYVNVFASDQQTFIYELHGLRQILRYVSGIDDATGSVKLPYDPAPELSFGHVAERLREAGSTNSSSS
jgi:hypothetical protein